MLRPGDKGQVPLGTAFLQGQNSAGCRDSSSPPLRPRNQVSGGRGEEPFLCAVMGQQSREGSQVQMQNQGGGSAEQVPKVSSHRAVAEACHHAESCASWRSGPRVDVSLGLWRCAPGGCAVGGRPARAGLQEAWPALGALQNPALKPTISQARKLRPKEFRDFFAPGHALSGRQPHTLSTCVDTVSKIGTPVRGLLC